ncbi:MAG TPA: GNAT family N-acetyltransferase [Candidatus Limnocylindria bacterium]|nr:GNAT family N-acetyltransferase [Candidatus Limnocylindria bacterium]
MTVTVRRVRAGEWQALRDLRLAALEDSPHAFSATLEQAKRRSNMEWRSLASLGAAGERWMTVVAQADKGRLVGMATGHFPDERHRPNDDPSIPSLMQMWVEPEHRRTGVGRALVKDVLRWADAKKAAVVRLEVNEADRGAVAFYTACGFSPTGRRDDTSLPGSVALEMESPSRPDRSPIA